MVALQIQQSVGLKKKMIAVIVHKVSHKADEPVGAVSAEVSPKVSSKVSSGLKDFIDSKDE